MTYHTARNGQTYGPYSLLEVQRYIVSGNILPTDLVQAEGMQEWLPVEQMFPTTPSSVPNHPGGLPRLYPDPPNLPWWLALIVGILTLGIFFQIWDVVEAVWMRRVERHSIALYLYIAECLLYVFKLPATLAILLYNIGDGPPVVVVHSYLVTLIGIFLFFATRFTLRRELLRHFNGPEPIGLHLNWFMTLLFGGLYFQYHFNRINELKRSLHISVPSL
ncbi:MAG: DUF4339 domain-containing protein [Acidobacteriaceae bacterium]